MADLVRKLTIPVCCDFVRISSYGSAMVSAGQPQLLLDVTELIAAHVIGMLRRVVAAGVSLAKAVRHCTLVPARHYGLTDRGAVAPGYRADLIVATDSLRPHLVVHQGAVVVRDGTFLAEPPQATVPAENTIHLAPLSQADFEWKISAPSCPVMCITPYQIVTRREDRKIRRAGGRWQFNADEDVVLIASIERHRATGRIGFGLVSGFGLRRGAWGSSVAHDSHNLIVAGTKPPDMLLCAETMRKMGGGLVVVDNGNVAAQLPLPVAGLLSTAKVDHVCNQLEEVRRAARRLGCTLPSPFGTLSFLSLPAIPELRVTDRGLLDVTSGCFIGL